METYYDIIIIGAGLAGLYSAYNIKKMYPNTNLILLESNKKQYIGGRIGNDLFYGEKIVIGAGVGREDTDYNLIKLLKELKIKYDSYFVTMHYSKLIKNPIDIKEYLKKLRKIYESYKNPPSVTFKQFATKHLKQEYNDFLISSGYSDYENEDVYEVLYHYQMEDNASGWTALNIPWSLLVSKLCNKIGQENIITSTKVEKIKKIDNNPCLFELTTQKKQYYSNKIIVATRISSVKKLLPQMKIYNKIHGQPFLYIYAKFDNKSSEIMNQLVPTYTIVPGLLQKIIPFSKSVYMIAYADNINAEILHKYTKNNNENKKILQEKIEKSLDIIPNTLKIIAIKSYYWPIGTHYYEPLDSNYRNRLEFIKKAQNPELGMLVVGEDVSRRQGWTEGALQSVDRVLNKEWISKSC